jgi:hypothetical protein
MIPLTFDLFFPQTIITNIVDTFFVLTTPHAFLSRDTTEVTVITLAVRFEFTVVETPDANRIVANFLFAAVFADVKITFITTKKV